MIELIVTSKILMKGIGPEDLALILLIKLPEALILLIAVPTQPAYFAYKATSFTLDIIPSISSGTTLI
jgi:hypothetical protein